ncbi:predicted protein [Sclerotinia sclerotiorum 1980 UF-70]|uniref:Uncharacterized protein n=2 Tax=Sclerotinia sclerotiorum (strain ATCC 18683 / 1980 / Ss-1) TaxID=665079 RepID=A7EJD6_SCLS1|nr:predicted protein [Sclerotinia sclerotiorum 1980 UF-70]APA11899.1 hypothetical protein sscle_08g066690 [Sclerotinia sclerotiorum 1980 UF-70]EDO02952.1 predicted protein [Sclerotinia sclerotiorum 1980 UF-70]
MTRDEDTGAAMNETLQGQLSVPTTGEVPSLNTNLTRPSVEIFRDVPYSNTRELDRAPGKGLGR